MQNTIEIVGGVLHLAPLFATESSPHNPGTISHLPLLYLLTTIDPTSELESGYY